MHPDGTERYPDSGEPIKPLLCRGIRGAITVNNNDREEILAATRDLLEEMIGLNEIRSEDVVSAYFTTTVDLNAAYPAEAARQIGWFDVPLICGHEMNVPTGLSRCIRILIHWNTRRSQKEVVHVYVGAAQSLRPDHNTTDRHASSQRTEGSPGTAAADQ